MVASYAAVMGFDRRKMTMRRAAEKEAAARRATDAQVLEDTERLIADWNERHRKADRLATGLSEKCREHPFLRSLLLWLNNSSWCG